ncbi:unnamed protein product [[Candida] boidinii]|nr:unnamed protein product [[Candida] boidinii]
MSAPRSSTIRTFKEVTGCVADNVAIHFLQRNQNKLTSSINDYFNNPQIVDQILFNGSKKSTRAVSIIPAVSQIFNNYREGVYYEPNTRGQLFIGIDGTIDYLSDLGYEPEDVRALVLAEFLESPSVGIFIQDVFESKWSSANCSSLEDMRAYIEKLFKMFQTDFNYFKKVYSFTYKFILEPNEKNIPYETAIAYWDLLLPEKYRNQLETFKIFLTEQWKQKITKDQWNMLIPFFELQTTNPQLENYDESASWPILIDTYVEYLGEHETS